MMNMNKNPSLEDLLKKLQTGKLSIDDCLTAIRSQGVHEMDFAHLDVDRDRRCGFPEVILADCKTPAQVTQIAVNLLKHHDKLLVTRADQPVFQALKRRIKDAVYNKQARCITANRAPQTEAIGKVLIISAGTSDIPVAEEAKVTAQIRGAAVETLYDVGVAGIHRLLGKSELIQSARVLVVVAGMEGALASVVGGLVRRPVIAVPTSVGYGASFNGVAALLGMLNTCAPGVSVVNIDNGFGAGYIASLINEEAASQ